MSANGFSLVSTMASHLAKTAATFAHHSRCLVAVMKPVAALRIGSGKIPMSSSRTLQTRTLSTLLQEGNIRCSETVKSLDGPRNQEEILARNTGFILRKIPEGKMNVEDVYEAERLMIFWSRKKSIEGAKKTEQLLERLISEEVERPNQRSFAVQQKSYNIAISAWGKSRSDKCGEKAEAIWKKMEKRYEEGRHYGSFAAKPDEYTIHSVMAAHAHSPSPDAPVRVEQLLSLLEELSGDPQSKIRLTTLPYNILINAYASRRGELGSAEKAEDVLLRMSEINLNGNSLVRPDTQSFNTVLKAWYNSSSSIESASRAENILRFMAKLHKDDQEQVRPDIISFRTCLLAYGNVHKGGLKVVERIENLLELLEEISVDDHNTDFTDCFNIAMKIILRSGVGDAGKRAESVYNRMTVLESERKMIVRPNDKTHALLLNARLGSEGVSGTPEYIISRLMSNTRGGGEHESGIDLNTSSLNKAMDVLWKSASEFVSDRSRLRDAAKQAEQVLSFMEMSPLINPDSASYNILITALLKSGAKGSVEQALNVIRRQEKSYNCGNHAAKPEAYGYNAVLTSVSKGDEPSISAEKSAEMAYEILKMMEKQEKIGNLGAAPDIIAYNITLKALAKAGNPAAADRALLLLKRLEEGSGSHHVYPDEITYGTALNALRRSGSRRALDKALFVFDRFKRACQDERSEIELDMQVYKTVLNILSRYGAEARHASISQHILQEMMEACNNGNQLLAPDSHCCNLAIKAFTNATYDRRTAMIAQTFLVDLVKQHRTGKMSALPSTLGFNYVLHAWLKSKDRYNSLQNAELILTLMKELKGEGIEHVRPDKATVSLMISIYAKQESALMAQRAQDLCDSIPDVEKDRLLVETLMNCWAKSDASNKVQKTQELLMFMEERFKQGEQDMCPTATTYNIVLNSCSLATSDKKLALEHALEAFRRIKCSKEVKPDQVTYSSMIRAVCNLAEDDSIKFAEVKEIFDECSGSGKVDDIVLYEIRRGLGAERATVILQTQDGLAPLEETKSAVRTDA